MRQLASEAGFSVDTYRRIGALELAGAVGVAVGTVVPLLGRLVGAGLLLLLAGALVTHVRKGAQARHMRPRARLCRARRRLPGDAGTLTAAHPQKGIDTPVRRSSVVLGFIDAVLLGSARSSGSWPSRS